MRQRIPLIPAVYVILRREDEVLLLKRKNTGYRDGEYSLVSGHVEDKEFPVAAAVREVKEEAGVDIEADDLDFVHVMHRIAEENNHERLDFFFEVTKWSGEVENMEPDKCDELKWSKDTELPENMIPAVRSVLDTYKKPQFYTEVTHN